MEIYIYIYLHTHNGDDKNEACKEFGGKLAERSPLTDVPPATVSIRSLTTVRCAVSGASSVAAAFNTARCGRCR